MKGLTELIVAGCILFGLLLTPLVFSILDFISGVRKAGSAVKGSPRTGIAEA
ncbi:hypothetical protein NXV95_15935 [Bacteroides fragilis]|nr:hypothetical protein [Bacteroides fragilis]